MSDPGHKIKSMWLHPKEDIMAAERHLAIVEVPLVDVVALLGLPADFVFKGAVLEPSCDMLRIKVQHPSFPAKMEGECIVVLPYVNG